MATAKDANIHTHKKTNLLFLTWTLPSPVHMAEKDERHQTLDCFDNYCIRARLLISFAFIISIWPRGNRHKKVWFLLAHNGDLLDGNAWRKPRMRAGPWLLDLKIRTARTVDWEQCRRTYSCLVVFFFIFVYLCFLLKLPT